MTFVAGAVTMLVLSALGALVLDWMRLREETSAAETAEADPEEVVGALTSSDSGDEIGASVQISSTTTPPVAALRIPVVTFQADGGQAFVTGTVPNADVYDRISASLAGIYGPENVVATGVVVDANTASAQWMDSVDNLTAALGGFDDYRIRFDGDTLTGFVGGGAEFTTSAADLPPGYDPVLAFVAGAMVRDPSLSLVVTGHTDSRGSDDTNLALSQARAQAAVDRLVQQGIDASRVVAEGKGPFNPTAPNDTAEGRARNRRVELTLTVGAVAPTDS